jgi:uncharacterized protein (DUF1800 family)
MEVVMSAETAAAVAVNRFGLGARPGELARIAAPTDWLIQQIKAGPPLLQDATLKSSRDIMAGAAELAQNARELGRDGKEALKNQSADTTDTAAAQQARQQLIANRLPRYYRPIYIADASARLRQAVASDNPFAERLVQFWSNHFAVSIDKVAVLGLAGAMEREAIRPNVMGKFRDLLLAVEKHGAMLLFLDNQLSIGPDSQIAQRAGRQAGPRRRQLGLNENLAREILELHTLGVDGGYTQADVTSFAKVITGWSIGGIRQVPARLDDGAEPGAFVFRPMLHQPGTQTLLGKRYAQDGVSQGEAVLRDLAASPQTARHIATKLARHFVADDPPDAVVKRLSSAYLKSDGDLPTVYRVLIDSPEAWSATATKYKTPNDYVISVYRGLNLPVPEGQQSLGSLNMLGQQQFMPGSPAGWPDKGADWDGSAALMKRIELANTLAQRFGNVRDAAALAPQLLGATLSAATRDAIARAESGPQALTLLLTAPEFLRR